MIQSGHIFYTRRKPFQGKDHVFLLISPSSVSQGLRTKNPVCGLKGEQFNSFAYAVAMYFDFCCFGRGDGIQDFLYAKHVIISLCNFLSTPNL